MSETVGKVIGPSRTTKFNFLVHKGKEPAVFEYIQLKILEEEDGKREEKTVLAHVVQTEKSHPAISERTPIEAVETIVSEGLDKEQTISSAKVIGYLDKDGNVIRPRHAPIPGTDVKKASDELLERFVEVENGLEIGQILTRPSVKSTLDIGGLNRHLAILAATGAGKSHTAGVIMEELLEKGATILVIDPHGDYIKMNRLKGKNKNYELADRIRVFKGRSAEEGIKLKIRTSDIRYDRLCSLAGIRGNASEQRRLVYNVIQDILEDGGEDYLYNLEEIIEGLEEIAEDPDEKSKNRIRAEKVAFKFRRLNRLGIFTTSGIELGEILKPQQLSVIDLSGLYFKAQDIIVDYFLNRVYKARLRERLGEEGEKFKYPVFTFIEEAHRFCPYKESTISKNRLETIASEGRKFGMFLTIITQRPSKINQNVLSQCNSMIVQRIINRKDKRSIAESSESFAEDMLDDLPGLNIGEAIITGPAVKVPSMVKIRERRTMEGGEDIDIVKHLREARNQVEEGQEGISDFSEEERI